MNTGLDGKPARAFKVRFTERIYRLHQGGVTNHAPRGGGIFELVEFPPNAEDGKVLYVGHVPAGGNIAETLFAVLERRGGLSPERLKVVHERMANLYFDAVLESDCAGEADWQDLAWALVQAKSPELNDAAAQPHSGRYGAISFDDLSA
jgi:hypothetical protein